MTTHTQKMVQSPSPPERSLVQRMDALSEANRIRTVRSKLKKDIKGGRKSILDILRSPPDDVETMKLIDLMLAAPKYGRTKAHKVLQKCHISPSKTIGGLSVRQRTEIVSMLRDL